LHTLLQLGRFQVRGRDGAMTEIGREAARDTNVGNGGESGMAAFSTTVPGGRLRIEANVAAIVDDLEAKAIPFRLVQPIMARGWARRRGGG